MLSHKHRPACLVSAISPYALHGQNANVGEMVIYAGACANTEAGTAQVHVHGRACGLLVGCNAASNAQIMVRDFGLVVPGVNLAKADDQVELNLQ